MRETSMITTAFAAVVACASPAMAADVITYNAAPSIAYNYGSGNDYVPPNSAVLTTSDPASQLATRFHIPFAVASTSTGALDPVPGVYTFALGTPSISFDYSFANMLTGEIQLFNLGTGQSYDSGVFTLGNNLLQDSQQLTFNFLSSLGFDGNVNDTYQINLIGTNTGGTHTLTAYAQVGTGAVPEPATWAMMLIGFGGIGFAMRRKNGTRKLPQLA